MSLSTEQCDCCAVDVSAAGGDLLAAEGMLAHPGDFFWLRDAAGRVTDIVLRIPGNEGGSVCQIPVVIGEPTQSPCAWGWDGNLERPTLKPSIWRNKPYERDGVLVQLRNEWHGHLESGRLVVR